MIALLGVTKYAVAQCLTSSTSEAGGKFKTTGDVNLDATINGEASSLSQAFGVTPSLYTLDDSQASNAFANCGDNVVMIGLRLLREELWSMDRGGLAVAGIMAHEFTHIYQCSHGGGLSTRDMELQADYMAGWYLKHQKSVYGLDVTGFARSLWSKGDYNFRESTHHGTPDQRVGAMAAGFGDSTTSTSTAFAHSVTFLGYDGGMGPTTTCEKRVTCTHLVTCQHTMTCQHPVMTTRVIECQHPVMTPYGLAPYHPSGDLVQELVPTHNYDVAHSRGDFVHDYDTQTYSCVN